MARIRTIKPEFFTSEDIVGLSPMARLLYIALWCEADREGRMLWKPRTFKMRYFPADQCDIDAMCAELVGAGLVKLYGEGLAYVPKFGAHQHLNPREAASQLPEPDATVTRGRRVSTRAATDSDAQGGRERKGRSKHASASDACDVLPEVNEDTLADWIAVRKAKRAGPITQTVADGLRREAALAGLSPQEAVRKAVERGWQGFEADWLTAKKTPVSSIWEGAA